jgi:hypothetical protein
LILLGDALDLAFSRAATTMMVFQRCIEALFPRDGPELFSKEVVFLPGNPPWSGIRKGAGRNQTTGNGHGYDSSHPSQISSRPTHARGSATCFPFRAASGAEVCVAAQWGLQAKPTVILLRPSTSGRDHRGHIPPSADVWWRDHDGQRLGAENGRIDFADDAQAADGPPMSRSIRDRVAEARTTSSSPCRAGGASVQHSAREAGSNPPPATRSLHARRAGLTGGACLLPRRSVARDRVCAGTWTSRWRLPPERASPLTLFSTHAQPKTRSSRELPEPVQVFNQAVGAGRATAGLVQGASMSDR